MPVLEAPTVYETPVNTAVTITDYYQYESGRYQRYKKLLEFKTSAIVPAVATGTAVPLAVQAIGFAAGGTVLALNAPGYVRIDMGVQAVSTDGVVGPLNVRASYKITGNEHAGNLSGTFADEADGPILLTYFGIDATGNSTKLLTHGAYLNRTGAAKDHPYCWIQNNTRNWETVRGWGYAPNHQYALVKVADLATTRVKPITRPVGPAFNTTKAAGQLTRIEVVPGDSSQNTDNALQVSPDGINNTEARQNYTYADLVLNWPVLPLLDGPRGVCTAPYTTDIVTGRNGKMYCANPWQCFVMDWQGNKRTLYGLRHKYPLNWNYTRAGGPEVEVVGDWDSSIPAGERFAWESWSMAWDRRSLFPINMTAPIPPNETEQPHASADVPQFGGPVHFRTDRHGYILRVAFDGKSHATPAKIVRWCAVNDPWSVACVGAYLYVWERGLHRISIWSADTPNTYLGDIIADPTASTLGHIDQPSRAWVGQDYPACRLHTIVAPEGGFILDGFIYWGSSAQHEVRRIPVSPDANGMLKPTGPYEVACRPTFNEKSFFVYIKGSPGTFGPRGMIAITTWSIANFGRPELFLPVAGVAADGTPLSHSKAWPWQTYGAGLIQGRGLVVSGQSAWESDSYGSAVDFGYEGNTAFPGDPAYGALACASANGNISVYCASDDTLDGPLLTGTPQANLQASLRRGTTYYQVHNETLFGSYCKGPNWALPWGQNPDQDVFMKACGCVQADTEEDPAVIAELQQQLAAAQTALTAAQAAATSTQTELDAANAQIAALQAKITAAQAALA